MSLPFGICKRLKAIMGGENSMRKSKNRVYRWIATMLTAALLVGQCRVPVLAEEETVPAEAEISEEDKSGAQESGTDGTENDAAEDGEEGADQNGTDNDDGDGGKEESGADDIATGDEGEDKDGEEGSQEKCICETVCTEDAVNGDCPVCAADYANCAKNAGGEVNLPEENGGEDTVSENDLAGKENAVLMAVDEGVTTLAVGDDFTYGKIRYVVTGDGEVEVGRQNANAVSGSLMIPNYVEDNKRNRYRVTSIGESAFFKCSNLTSVTIPNSVTTIKKAAFNDCGITSVTISDSVTSIGYAAFAVCKRLRKVEIPKNVKSIEDYTFSGCDELTSVTLPDSVTSIGKDAFQLCFKLTRVNIPKGVTSIGEGAFALCALTQVTIPESVTSIGKEAFTGCEFTSVTIPKGVTSLEDYVFSQCRNLTTVTISDNVTCIGNGAFWRCSCLDKLQIVVTVPTDGDIKLPSVGKDAFTEIPDRRFVAFFASNATAEGAEAALDKAEEVYVEAAKHDGDPNDDRWYGWFIGALPEVVDTYKVSVGVQKDNVSWGDSGRIFALTKDNGTTFITNFDAVEAGTYTIYEVTGLNADEFQTKGLKTGVTVPVDADVSVTVDYYTATFYDIDADGNEVQYGNGTDQGQQAVLKTYGRVSEPATNPTKEGYTFEQWVTAPDGDAEFKFTTTPIAAPTKIYAKWTKNAAPTYTVTINVKKDGKLWSGHGRTFALFSGGNSGFLEVSGQTGDSSYSIKQVPNGTYRVYDITGVPADSIYSRAKDTGIDVRVSGADTEVDVTVAGADVEKDVQYYTATFYDGPEDYKAGTPQEPQIVLRGKQVAKPEDPQKENWQFAGWKTTNGGTVDYDFGAAVTDTTNIFAKWVEKTAGDDKPDDDDKPGGDGKPDGGDRPDGGGDTRGGGDGGTEDIETVVVVQTSAPQAVNSEAGNVQASGGAEKTAAANGKEPKTGDPTPVEVYATVAMIAGLTYLLLYFVEESRGMSEREKEVFVAAFIRWAKKGGRFRKCCAIAAIFCLLVYYHSIGKYTYENMLRRTCLKQL